MSDSSTRAPDDRTYDLIGFFVGIAVCMVAAAVFGR